MKKAILSLIMALVLVVILTACDNNELSGTWEWKKSKYEDEEYSHTLTLSGKSFKFTTYEVEEVAYHDYQTGGSRIYAYNPQATFFVPTEDEKNNKIVIGTFSKEISVGVNLNTNEPIIGGIADYEFSEITMKGTYSMSDNVIEFVLSDNTVIVWDVSYTENTMTIINSDGEEVKLVREGKKR